MVKAELHACLLWVLRWRGGPRRAWDWMACEDPEVVGLEGAAPRGFVQALLVPSAVPGLPPAVHMCCRPCPSSLSSDFCLLASPWGGHPGVPSMLRSQVLVQSVP